MHKFTDALGRRWEVSIDPRRMEAVRQALGIVLPALLDQDMQPLAALLNNPPVLAGVLYVLCSEQATPRGVTSAEFTVNLEDPTTVEAAAAALAQELFDVYASQRGLVVRHIPAFDRAAAAIIDRSTKKAFNTVIPTPELDPKVARPAEERG